MVFAFWIVGGYFFVVYFGTLALQAAIILLQLASVIVTWSLRILACLAAVIWLAVFDRKALGSARRQGLAS